MVQEPAGLMTQGPALAAPAAAPPTGLSSSAQLSVKMWESGCDAPCSLRNQLGGEKAAASEFMWSESKRRHPEQKSEKCPQSFISASAADN